MKESLRLVQISHKSLGRKVALVQEPLLIILSEVASIYDLAAEAIETQRNIEAIIKKRLSDEQLQYDVIYEGRDEWVLLPSFDCPHNPFSCIVSGTGLTHKNSALNRQVMHQAEANTLTDSMKIYQWGLEGGQVKEGTIGVQPEWFYKGTGETLKAHGEPLTVPAFASDGGEEPEVAAIYIIDKKGQPYRVGYTTGNEFSDHVMERKNYLYLAPSKLRNCAIGPELVIDASFTEVQGTVSIFRNKEILWSANINSGEKNMAHSLSNLEYHHFKYAGHRIPHQAHVHFFGADAFSFGAGITLETNDEMVVSWQGLGRPLRNQLLIEDGKENYISVKTVDKIEH